MFPVIRSFVLIVIALVPVALGQAAGNPLPENQKKSGRQTWIVATSLPEGVKSPVTVLAGGKLCKVRLSKRSVGTAIAVPKDGPIQVVKPFVSDEGKKSYESLVSVMIPEEFKQSLIILTPVPNLKPPLKFKARVIDLDHFRGGNALFVNHTGLEIGVALGEKKALLHSGQIQIINCDDFSGSKNVPVSYHYRIPKQKNWNLISASTVTMRSSLREILIFSFDAQLGQVDYHGISFHAGM